jgi:hypothetical protein
LILVRRRIGGAIGGGGGGAIDFLGFITVGVGFIDFEAGCLPFMVYSQAK